MSVSIPIEMAKVRGGAGTDFARVRGTLYANGASVDDSTGTTEQKLGEYTVPANTLNAIGQALNFKIYGNAATTKGCTMRLAAFGTNLFSGVGLVDAAKIWSIDLTITCNTTGGSGVVTYSVVLVEAFAAGPNLGAYTHLATGILTSIDLTASKTVTLYTTTAAGSSGTPYNREYAFLADFIGKPE